MPIKWYTECSCGAWVIIDQFGNGDCISSCPECAKQAPENLSLGETALFWEQAREEHKNYHHFGKCEVCGHYAGLNKFDDFFICDICVLQNESGHLDECFYERKEE